MNRSYHYAGDCIHIEACRRLCDISAKYGMQLNRQCRTDTCSAYKTNNDIMFCEPCHRFINWKREKMRMNRSFPDIDWSAKSGDIVNYLRLNSDLNEHDIQLIVSTLHVDPENNTPAETQ